MEEVEELVEGVGVVEHMLWEALGVMATLETWALEGESWESKSSQLVLDCWRKSCRNWSQLSFCGG